MPTKESQEAREHTISNPDLPESEQPLAIAREARRQSRQALDEVEKIKAGVAGLAANINQLTLRTEASNATAKIDRDRNKTEILQAVSDAFEGAKRIAKIREEKDEENTKTLKAHTVALDKNSELLTAQAERVTTVEKKVTELSAKDVGKIALAVAGLITAFAGAITLFAVMLAPVFAASLPRILENRYPAAPAISVTVHHTPPAAPVAPATP